MSGDTDGAVEAYRGAILIDDRDAWAMNNLALILIERGEYEEALLPLARAIEIDDSRAVFWNNLGMALERTGRYRSAEEAYGTAFEADDGHDRAYANLVRIQNVSEEPGVETVDLTELAHRFIAKMEDWKLAVAGDETDEVTALTDSLTIGIAAVALPDTSKAGPE
jgi:Flp pilus assembly protein TadD